MAGNAQLLGGPLDGLQLPLNEEVAFSITLPLETHSPPQRQAVYERVATASSDILYVFVKIVTIPEEQAQ